MQFKQFKKFNHFLKTQIKQFYIGPFNRGWSLLDDVLLIFIPKKCQKEPDICGSWLY